MSAHPELPGGRGRATLARMWFSAWAGAGLVLGVVGVVCGAGLGLGACATTQPAVTYEQIDQRKQEIAMLWSQIRGWRQDAGLRGVEPPPRAILEMRGKTTAQAARVCPQPVQPETPRCSDVCSLADAICENADRICRIADELGGDAWADGKCSSAKASCKEAREACCRCWSEEPPAESAAPLPAGHTGEDPSDDRAGEPRSESPAGGADAAESDSFRWKQAP